MKKRASLRKVEWEGDPSQFCFAKWAALMLSAELMPDNLWRWAIHDVSGKGIDNSDNHEGNVRDGKLAMDSAEQAAKKYINDLPI